MAERYVSRAEIAEKLELSERQITNLVKEHDFPRRVAGRAVTFPAGRCLEWYLDFKHRERLARSNPSEAPDIEKAKARREQALAEKAELEVAQLRGRLVPVEFMAAEFDRILQALRASLVSFPAAWADRLGACQTTPERQLMLTDAVAEMMPLLEAATDDEEGVAA